MDNKDPIVPPGTPTTLILQRDIDYIFLPMVDGDAKFTLRLESGGLRIKMTGNHTIGRDNDASKAYQDLLLPVYPF